MEDYICKKAMYACRENSQCMEQMETRLVQYTREKDGFYRSVMPEKAEECLLSDANWLLRKDSDGSYSFGLYVHPGDICWLDYGHAYNKEMGFQHFGLILTICYSKALIVPLTSSRSSYAKAYGPGNPNGSKYLMRIGVPEGLRKESTLYLNDFRFINTARIIERRGYIHPQSPLFKEIKRRVCEILNATEEECWSC